MFHLSWKKKGKKEEDIFILFFIVSPEIYSFLTKTFWCCSKDKLSMNDNCNLFIYLFILNLYQVFLSRNHMPVLRMTCAAQHVTWNITMSCTESTLVPNQSFQSLFVCIMTCTIQGGWSYTGVHMVCTSSPANLLLSGVWSSAGFRSRSLQYCSLILHNGPVWTTTAMTD